MTKEVKKAESTEVSTSVVGLDDFGMGQVSGSDIVIPKILVMQKMSDAVDREVAVEGDFLDSVTEEKLGSIKEPLDFIPFHLTKTWVVQKVVDGDYRYDRTEDVTPQNENRQWEEVIGGEKYRFQKSYNFYVLLANDPSMPYVLAFRSTASKTGRALATQMYVKNRAQGKVPPAYVMELGGVKEKNDKGSFVIPSTKVKRAATNDEILAALDWYKTLNTKSVKVDDSDEHTDTSKRGFVSDSAQF